MQPTKTNKKDTYVPLRGFTLEDNRLAMMTYKRRWKLEYSQ